MHRLDPLSGPHRAPLLVEADPLLEDLPGGVRHAGPLEAKTLAAQLIDAVDLDGGFRPEVLDVDAIEPMLVPLAASQSGTAFARF